MRMRRLTLLAITVAMLLLVLDPVAQAPDKNVGTWKLNLTKSKYVPGPHRSRARSRLNPRPTA